MSTKAVDIQQATPRDWLGDARALAAVFGKRAVGYDETTTFVTENYRDLAENELFSAGIPVELGGGGATHEELCGIVRELGRRCGSTALAFAMHTHVLALNVFKYLRDDEGAARTLAKLAADELVIAGTGANDWLESSGTAERVEGGYRVTARKRFVSGCPGADILVTSAVHETGEGREVLHFSIPFANDGVRIIETWWTLGMRGTGSHDVALENAFVPDAAIAARRPAGEWHTVWEMVLPIALPLITAAYVGSAETAAELAVEAARRKPAEAGTVGRMTNALAIARMALSEMTRINDNYRFTPSLSLTNTILTHKAIAAEAVAEVVDLAAELVGGPGFFRGHAIERILRDVRAMNFHPLPIRRQQVFSGRQALGLDPIAAG